MNDNWMASWQRARNHGGFTRGMRALLALGCVLALGWRAGWEDELMPVVLGVMACAFTETDDDWRGRGKTLLLALPGFAVMMAAVWLALPWPALLAALLALSAFSPHHAGSARRALPRATFGALVLFNHAALSAQNLREQALELAPYLLGGAVWYGLISLLWAALWPPTVRHRLSQLYALLGEYQAQGAAARAGARRRPPAPQARARAAQRPRGRCAQREQGEPVRAWAVSRRPG